MPLPDAQCLATIEVVSASSSLALTTAGICHASGTILKLGLPAPNGCYTTGINFLRVFSPTNPPYSLATILKIASNSYAVLTPGFESTLNVCNLSANISMALVSPSILAEGLLTYIGYGLPTVLQGPPDGIQVPFNSLGLANSIAASGSTTSVVIPSYYYPHIVMGITSTQTGALNIQRYIDVAGTIANGSAITAALTANTAAVSDTVSALGFGSFTVQITNTGASTATISGYALLLLAR